MKQKIFQTKDGVALYVDFEKAEYSTTNINAVNEALNKDLSSAKDRAAAQTVLNIIKTIDEKNQTLK